MTSKARLSSIFVVSVAVFVTAACGGSNKSSETTSPPSTQKASTSAAASGTAQPAAKVSANTASESEIEAALARAGVKNPGRWAEEVVEYRPYPTDDPNLTKLRQNLAKYNPGQETVDKIVSALTP
jgi:hypothetical protein